MYKRWNGMVAGLVIATGVFLIGCDPSNKDKKESKEAARIEQENAEMQRQAELHTQLKSRYGEITFVSDGWNADTFTFEIQESVNKTENAKFLMDGRLDDIEQTKEGLIVKFVASLGGKHPFDKVDMVLRLKANPDQVSSLLKSKRPPAMLRGSTILIKPTHTVVAKIMSVGRVRRYEFYGMCDADACDEESGSELDVDFPPRYVATGVLLEAIEKTGKAH